MRGAEAPPPPVLPPPPPPARPAAVRRAASDQAAQDIGAAIIRGQVVLLDCLRALATTIHPPPAIPSVDDFLRVVAWPGDRPLFSEGAGPAAAAAGAGDAATRADPADSGRDPATDTDAVQEDLAAIAAIAAGLRAEAETEVEAEREPAGGETAGASVIEPPVADIVEEEAPESVEPEATAADGDTEATEVAAEDTPPEDDSPAS